MQSAIFKLQLGAEQQGDNRMKKLLMLILTVVLCLCCLTSCSGAHKENTWFSEEKLTNCLVADLPTITKDYINHNDEDIYVSFTDSEFESYVKAVYNYLCLQEYEYLGTRGDQKTTLAGTLTTYYFQSADELSSFLIDGDYIFVFSDGAVDEYGDVEFNVLICYNVSTSTLEYGNKKFAYNTMISLRRGSEAPMGGFYVLKEDSMSNVGGADGPETVYSNVAVSKTESDDQESSYEVSAYLPGTDFSTIGQSLSDKIEKEWDTYNNMTREQQLTSSKLWGLVGIQVDSWNECEETIGFDVFNPIESIDWLNATGYFGMESADSNTEVKHILINANTMQSATNVDGKLTEITISSGYSSGKVKITLSATLCATPGSHTTGSVTNGYATYEQKTVSSGSGIPVLIVTTHESNNNGYYNGDYYDPVAYWVKDKVFYSLRVFGDEVDKDEIQAVLESILQEI